jgi:predicted dehydrogenase
MGKEQIRVGVIGAGGIARGYHLGSYARAGGTQVVAVCDVDEGALEVTREVLGVQHTYLDYREMLTAERLDLVSVCTPNDMHYPVVMAAIAQGVDAFCEKPLAMTVSEAQEMVAGAEAKGLKTGVNFAHRRTPAAMLAREILASGVLGPVHYVSAVYAAGGSDYASRPGTWRNQKELAGYGGLGDMGSHVLDMTMWWLDADVVDVTSTTRTYVPQRVSRATGQPMRVTTDDQGMLLMAYSNGAMGYLCGSYMFTGRGYDQRIEVYAANGGMMYNQQRPNELDVCMPAAALAPYTVLRKGGAPDTPYTTILVPERLTDRIPGVEGRRTVLMDFLDAYRATGVFRFTPGFAEGLKVQQVLEASRLAEETRSWVRLT